ncbi:ectoine hydroxylase [Ammoniphilus sp. CFH 90114]|uniref:ectoine hydroxylase n=1 Tax=Ammoniphilus sp. CFH 90114 TaxID=2493665 RepID=UPI00100DA9AC|nr:ectoine hydroxylase [Ammoniphilus sp. CFH 90114]RXT04924.1 ectoine hydroxylase [Ammoniphilus sp. CFH 90114]
MIDIYPSRISSKPTITERKDPVVYSPLSKSGPLRVDQLKSYEENGFLFLESFFTDAEVEMMRDELSRVMDQSKDSTAKEVIREPQSQEVRSVFAVHNQDLFFERLSNDKRLVEMMQQLLGSDVYIHQSRINLKSGFTGKEFYWHSDFETWHVEDGMPRMRAISCSITLTENTPFNGPLMLIPRSHKRFVSCVGETPEDHYEKSLRKQEYGVPDQDSLTLLAKQGGIVAPTGPAGSIILFDCNIMHGSNSNISPLPRSNVFFVFNSVENRLVQPFSGQKPRPEYIAARESVLSSL